MKVCVCVVTHTPEILALCAKDVMGQNMSGLGYGIVGIVVGGVGGGVLGYELGATLARVAGVSKYATGLGMLGALMGVRYGIGYGPFIGVRVGYAFEMADPSVLWQRM